MAALQYIFKINNYCNLDCSYCYQSYSSYKALNLKAKNFEHETIVACARAAVENAIATWRAESSPPQLLFVIQGGEPLLSGKASVDRLLATLRRMQSDYDLDIRLNTHSNGSQIDQEWCGIFLRNNCSLTVSLDGPAEFHDRTRRDRRGRPTHAKAVNGIQIALQQGVDTGCMCVVSPDAGGAETQRFFEELGITRIGYLLPTVESGTPPGKGGYGRFLKDAFDAWINSPQDNVRVQIFDAALRACAGKPSGLAGVGGYHAEWISFTSEGGVEAGDPFGLCNFGHNDGPPHKAIAEIQKNPFYRLQAQGGFVPSGAPCSDCDVRDICQGGFLVHRHDGKGGFDQPSYYCSDLLDFYTHVKATVREVANEYPAH